MSPKEKARELVNKFRPYSYSSDGFNSMEREYQIEDNSKKCALIAVAECLRTCSYLHVEYWQEVKQEIEKL